MSDPYKAILRYDALGAEPFATSLLYPMPFSAIMANQLIAYGTIKDWAKDHNNLRATLLIRRAKEWLEENGRAADLLMIYDNTDHDKGVGQITLTFSDRDTALLLKLAMT